jgi:cytochrome o ubiquinol oxidase subunit III
MNVANTVNHHELENNAIDVFGFWLYIMTDCILFGALFAAYIVLHQPGSYGPSLKPLIDLYYVLGETVVLLLSNFSFGLAILESYKNRKGSTIILLCITFILGATFITMEIKEFIHLVNVGYNWQVSGAASAFFTLVATHGLHVFFGLLWIALTILQIHTIGLNAAMHKRLTYLGLFWNFLDIVWIFVFTVVYLLGAIL